MSFQKPPARPVGTDAEALWVQWVHDELATYGNLINNPGIRFERTTKGVRPILSAQAGGAVEKFHPFELYQSPAHDTATDWRTFRVRAGSYGTTPVAGTDGADVAAGGNTAQGVNSVEDPATETLDADYNTSIDFIVPDATASYYVWIDATDTAAPEIDKGATPPGSGDDSAWWGGSYVLLAIIDTSTFTATKIAKWRQFVNYNIPKCS